MPSEFKFYQKKTKLILGGAISAAFLIGFLIMLFIGPNPDSIFRPFRSPVIFYPVMIVGLILFGALARYAFNSLRNPKPRVTLSESGVLIEGFSGRFSAPWEEFSGYELIRDSIYVLRLKDAEGFAARLPAGRAQQTARALSQKFGSPFMIETALLEADPATIQNVLASRLPLTQA